VRITLSNEDYSVPILDEGDWIKHNLLALAREHKYRCEGECNISLIAVYIALKKLGIEITPKELREIA
jgi:hypothetical protein